MSEIASSSRSAKATAKSNKSPSKPAQKAQRPPKDTESQRAVDNNAGLCPGGKSTNITDHHVYATDYTLENNSAMLYQHCKDLAEGTDAETDMSKHPYATDSPEHVYPFNIAVGNRPDPASFCPITQNQDIAVRCLSCQTGRKCIGPPSNGKCVTCQGSKELKRVMEAQGRKPTTNKVRTCYWPAKELFIRDESVALLFWLPTQYAKASLKANSKNKKASYWSAVAHHKKTRKTRKSAVAAPTPAPTPAPPFEEDDDSSDSSSSSDSESDEEDEIEVEAVVEESGPSKGKEVAEISDEDEGESEIESEGVNDGKLHDASDFDEDGIVGKPYRPFANVEVVRGAKSKGKERAIDSEEDSDDVEDSASEIAEEGVSRKRSHTAIEEEDGEEGGAGGAKRMRNVE